MREALLLVSTVPAGVAILISYIVVLGNVANAFPLQMNAGSSTSSTSSTSSMSSTAGDYFASPYWLGWPRGTCIAITMLQVLAGFGYIAWFVWLLDAPASVFEHSLLKTRLMGSSWCTHSSSRPSPGRLPPTFTCRARRSLGPCSHVHLYGSRPAVILLVGGTFEAARTAASYDRHSPSRNDRRARGRGRVECGLYQASSGVFLSFLRHRREFRG